MVRAHGVHGAVIVESFIPHGFFIQIVAEVVDTVFAIDLAVVDLSHCFATMHFLHCKDGAGCNDVPRAILAQEQPELDVFFHKEHDELFVCLVTRVRFEHEVAQYLLWQWRGSKIPLMNHLIDHSSLLVQNPTTTVTPTCSFRNIAKCASFRILIHMKQNTLITLLCGVLLAAGIYHIVQVSRQAPKDDAALRAPMGNSKVPSAMPAKNTGPTAYLYDYECDEHVAFEVSFAPNISALHIAPKDKEATFPPKGVLLKQPADFGVRYTNKDLVFTGKGEGVTLGEGEQALHCSPIPSKDLAPMNFGN